MSIVVPGSKPSRVVALSTQSLPDLSGPTTAGSTVYMLLTKAWTGHHNALSACDHWVVLRFYKKYRLSHPENHLFPLSKKNIFWIKVSKNNFISFCKQKHRPWVLSQMPASWMDTPSFTHAMFTSGRSTLIYWSWLRSGTIQQCQQQCICFQQ